MPMELLDESQEDILAEVPPIDIKVLDEQIKDKLTNLINEKPNYLATEVDIINFFKSPENTNCGELILSGKCDLKIIATLKDSILKYLDERRVIGADEQERYDFKSLVNEITRDALHSNEQGISNPEFIVRLNNLNNIENFSFDLLNPDKKLCKDWKRLSAVADINAITGYEENAAPMGMGAVVLKDATESLHGRLYYGDIRNKEGEKIYTLTHFERFTN